MEPPASIIRGQNYISKSLKNASSQALKKYENYSLKNGWGPGSPFCRGNSKGDHIRLYMCMCDSKLRNAHLCIIAYVNTHVYRRCLIM